ncbi:hypothetical protein N7447_010928 [Penicillium robsamsonii]|uniref:uncharacterized protein n=1 Tax=Penicillium robsamsonii TaxID=1792511 RepID=UPI0025487DDC|nr:uncharacterized protein N7447_010928 [Penicillium robsamsonii]KAJ5807472.1 hypothetical protein N7447_010928 [Penicillium robsamsonii]
MAGRRRCAMRAGGTTLTNGSVVASNSWTTRSKGKNMPVTAATLTLSSRQSLINVTGDGTVVERNWGKGGRVSRTRERVGKQKGWNAISHQDKTAVHGKNC